MDLRREHVKQGWKDVGYHFFIRSNGVIQRGRPVEMIGAHCRGHNIDSIGICLNGLTDFNMEQFTSLKQLLRTLKPKFPNATIHGHCEFSDKTCPVFDYDWVRLYWDGLGTEFGEGG